MTTEPLNEQAIFEAARKTDSRECCSMTVALPTSAPSQDSGEKTLVKNACAYLKQRLQKLAPDAVLTHAWDSFYETYTNILRRMAGRRSHQR